MPRGNRQGKQDLVLEQHLRIEILLGRQEIPCIVLKLLLREIVFAFDELQQTTQLKPVRQRFETALTTQRKNSVDLDQQLRPLPRSRATVDPIVQTPRRFRQQIV